jgi:hypothetical protein
LVAGRQYLLEWLAMVLVFAYVWWRVPRRTNRAKAIFAIEGGHPS